jgi:hypothetical protein
MSPVHYKPGNLRGPAEARPRRLRPGASCHDQRPRLLRGPASRGSDKYRQATPKAAHLASGQPIRGRSVSPDYADFCIGAGYGHAFEGCVTMTRDGKLFISVGGGLSTPGLLASGNVANINGNVSNCEIDSFASGWSITGYGGDGVGVGGTWGDVGQWGPGTTSSEAGLTTPGLSAVGTYSWHVP